VDDATVPDEFSIQEDHQPVIDMSDADPVFYFHCMMVLVFESLLISDTKMPIITFFPYDEDYFRN
jgi:hypothetical protein